ncbi:MAG: hypothetical protein RO257_18285 [Candidatus Kapabacteria bacterium]|nr:hypothetical protein [Candidatus Kapabacteria bacterium]
MKYELIKSDVFTKKAGKLLKRNPEFIPLLSNVLITLKEYPFSPTLKTHKLKGNLRNSYACSLNYEYRIIFKILYNFQLESSTENVIYLETIGTHDEVY